MTYQYQEATAVIGPLSPTAMPGAFDLCADHLHTVSIPRGWQIVRLKTDFEEAPPSDSDLMALADAIRETSKRPVPPPTRAQREIRRPADIGSGSIRRASLHAVPAADADATASPGEAGVEGAHVDNETHVRGRQAGETGEPSGLSDAAGTMGRPELHGVDLSDADSLLDKPSGHPEPGE